MLVPVIRVLSLAIVSSVQVHLHALGARLTSMFLVDNAMANMFWLMILFLEK
jgi:hypothetical protein